MTPRALPMVLALVLASCGACDDSELETAIALSGGDGTPELREIVIPSAPPEAEGSSVFGPSSPLLTHVVRQIRAVAEHEHARGLYLRIGPLGSWSRASEIAHAIAEVRAAGKPVHCHFDLADNTAYWLLTRSCDRINMLPGGYLELIGFSAQAVYFRSMFSEMGIQAEMLQVGRFKGAADPFIRDDMPTGVRENLDAVLEDYARVLKEAIAQARPIAPEALDGILDQGPFDAISAREAHLVDDVGFEDEAREHARIAAGVDRVRNVRLRPQPEEIGLGDLLGALTGEHRSSASSGPRIVVVRLVGTIVDGESGDEARIAGPFVEHLVQLADDEEVRGVVLRIDSPGGSALASDRMWEAVRRVAHKKPIVVSVGDMAASGGYYIASAASRVFATNTSLVGSIGVVAGKVNLSELMNRIGVSSEILTTHAHSAYSTPFRSWTAEERAFMETRIRATYHLFLRRIASGRPEANLELGAAGRIMTAGRAIQLGLVDELGGLAEAVAYTRGLAELDADATIEYWPRERGALENLARLMGGDDSALRAPGTAQLLPFADQLGELTTLASIFERESIAAVLPYRVRVR